MAKSLRSKVKRSFRSKKREEGVYAAHNAARLHRLNNKLLDIVAKDPEQAQPSEETAAEPGWCWFAAFALMDPNEISFDSFDPPPAFSQSSFPVFNDFAQLSLDV